MATKVLKIQRENISKNFGQRFLKLSFVEAGNGILSFGSSNWSAMVASMFGSHVHDISSVMRIHIILFTFPRGCELRSQLVLYLRQSEAIHLHTMTVCDTYE